ncbi:MAG: flagellar protein FlaG [Actinomycetota bacterium]
MQINFFTQVADNTLIKTPPGEKSNIVQSKNKKTSVESKPVQDDKLENLKNSLAEHNISLKFSQDKETKQLVVELIDDKTGDSIRQIPTEVSLKLHAMSIKIQGQFVDDKV